MNWEMVGALAELGGATAVVISLLYLAKQLQENALQAKVAAYQSVNARTADWRLTIASDQKLSDLYRRGLMGGLEALSDSEQVQFILLVHGLLRLFEEARSDLSQGVFPEWADPLIEQPLTDLMATPGYQGFWRLRKHQFSADFVRYAETLDTGNARPVHGRDLESADPDR